MSGSVTPTARGISPAMRFVLARASIQRSAPNGRLGRAGPPRGPRRRRAAGLRRAWGSVRSTSRPRASASLKRGEQRAVGGALADLLEAIRTESRAIEQLVPALLLSGAGQGLVLGGEDAEVLCLALGSLEGFVRGEVRALVGEHAGEHLAGALRWRSCRRGRWQDPGRSSCRRRACWTRARASRRRTAPRGSWSARPSRARCRPSGLGCGSGRGVGELDVLGDVVGRQHHLGAAAAAAHGHGAVGVGGGDDEAVAVLHPALARRSAGGCSGGSRSRRRRRRLALRRSQPRLGDRSLGDPVGSRPAVQLGDGGGCPRRSSARLAGFDVGLPGRVDGVEQLSRARRLVTRSWAS